MVLLLSKCCGKMLLVALTKALLYVLYFGNDMFYIFTKFMDDTVLVIALKDLVAKFHISKVFQNNFQKRLLLSRMTWQHCGICRNKKHSLKLDSFQNDNTRTNRPLPPQSHTKT